jgi:hypothetical protein
VEVHAPRAPVPTTTAHPYRAPPSAIPFADDDVRIGVVSRYVACPAPGGAAGMSAAITSAEYTGMGQRLTKSRHGLAAGPAAVDSAHRPGDAATTSCGFWYCGDGSLLCTRAQDRPGDGTEANRTRRDVRASARFGPPLPAHCRVAVALDMDQGTLEFFVDGVATGVAFRFPRAEGEEPEPLFPCIWFGRPGDSAVFCPPSKGVIEAVSTSAAFEYPEADHDSGNIPAAQ